MLSHLIVKNSKSIGEPGIELELKPLTILVGPNGSGKSSILEAAYFFRASGQWRNSQFRGEELFYKQDPKRNLVVEVCLADGTGLETSVTQNTETIRVKADDTWWDAASGGAYYQQKSGEIQGLLTDKMFFVSGLRGDVPRDTGPRGDVVSWTGPKGENLVYILNQLNEPEYIDSQRKVERWAGEFGVKDLWAGLRRNSLHLMYRDQGVLLPGILASHGARQILTIIANLFYCPPDSVFLIEEPEISLHPEAQVKLVEMFAEAIKEGKQIIATTHSSLLVLALNRPIRKGDLRSDQVAIYDVTKGENGTQVTRLELTGDGYIKGWIPSFKKVEQELMGEWVQSLPAASTPDA